MYAKEKGEIAELEFLLAATRRGFIVSSPFGDSCEYDFIIDYSGVLNRIQLKSAWSLNDKRDRYEVRIGRGKNKRAYDSVDFVVAYVNDENAWYIGVLKADNSICLYPHRHSVGTYEKFRDCWYLLEGAIHGDNRS